MLKRAIVAMLLSVSLGCGAEGASESPTLGGASPSSSGEVASAQAELVTDPSPWSGANVSAPKKCARGCIGARCGRGVYKYCTAGEHAGPSGGGRGCAEYGVCDN